MDERDGRAISPGRRKKLRTRALAASALLVLIALLVSFSAYRVEGDSMAPTLRGGRGAAAGDIVIVNRVAYLLRAPRRWDVVVVNRREADSEKQSHLSVKRIVGLPGEEIEIANGRCLVGGTPLEPPPSIAGVYVVSRGPFGRGRIRLREDEYFVLGDESYVSLDSRSWGPVRREDLRGRVDWIVFPPARIGKVR